MTTTAPTMVFIDGKDIGELGFIVSTVVGWRDIPRSRKATVKLAGRDGDIAVELGLGLSPRVITVKGAIQQDTFSNLQAAVDELGGRLLNVSVVRFVDNNDRFINAVIEHHSIVPMAAQFTAPELSYQFVIRADDPIIRETADTSDTFTITKKALPQGTYPADPLITINGAVSPIVNPSIIYRDGASVIITQMDITASVANGDRIEIDTAAHTVIHYISSVPNNIIDDISGSFIKLDPTDADDPYAGSPVWPSLECTPTANCDVDYKKAYVS